MFLNYFSLGILFMGLLMVFYGFIYLHDLPHSIAKKRKHPQTEAIHVACWLSLFTLHAIWPIVFIWAISNRQPVPVAMSDAEITNRAAALEQLKALEARLTAMEHRLTNSTEKSPSASEARRND
jgi:hypothetical protein